ncbi:uncharacterized protein BJ212DRAFT_1298132 [Suillus subaureus]|uniref:CxC6 like cysteine cluster associated with KDZ domain-containing protein n=1 Tax=Suillus subaureus TaxID=48587 RepID=A0A9P7EER8_9AGAM|nr:uncharacterized protein BJ212DRAFT_1298132 [Suillus subaureus]KAG1819694.1 hypothetical protein BJ212DRAFT_1298132 [Suillus subaureus]
MSVTTEEVWDTFIILALLDDHQDQGTRLCVSHGNNQSDHFTAVMQACNEKIITHGQEELPHACLGCMRLFTMPDGTTYHTEVVVTDGITVGCPCCAVPHCKNALISTHHCFCSANHKYLEAVCAVDGCDKPVIHDKSTRKPCKACSNPLHLRMEDAKSVLSQSRKSKTQRMKSVKLNNALAASSIGNAHTLEDVLPVQDIDEWFEHDPLTGNVCIQQASVTSSTGVVDPSVLLIEPQCNSGACPSKDEVPKLKVVFFHKWTNNEQLFICPCGVISGHGTMYHHEAVSNVLASNQFCQECCDMKTYPELLDEQGKYYFNSSIAEQTNIWFDIGMQAVHFLACSSSCTMNRNGDCLRFMVQLELQARNQVACPKAIKSVSSAFMSKEGGCMNKWDIENETKKYLLGIMLAEEYGMKTGSPESTEDADDAK